MKRLLLKIPRFRLLKSGIVGILATLADLAVLNGLVRLAGVSPQAANLPSLLAGTTIQFLGNRNFAFEAFHGHWSGQAIRFFAIETVAFGLNALLYYLMVEFTTIPFTLARMLGCFCVFFGFSYPLWKKVFQKGTVPA